MIRITNHADEKVFHLVIITDLVESLAMQVNIFACHIKIMFLPKLVSDVYFSISHIYPGFFSFRYQSKQPIASPHYPVIKTSISESQQP